MSCLTPADRRTPRWCASCSCRAWAARRARAARRRCWRARSPSWRSLASTSLNSPFLSRTTGASTEKRAPSGSSSTRSTICWMVCEAIALAAVPAVHDADARPEQAQVVVDLGDRADRRARVVRRRLLLDRDRRRQPLDRVDVGLAHLLEELARVGRQRLDVAALPLGVDRVEGERRLPRARQPGDDDQLVARDLDVDVLEVVLARALDDDLVHRPGPHARFMRKGAEHHNMNERGAFDSEIVLRSRRIRRRRQCRGRRSSKTSLRTKSSDRDRRSRRRPCSAGCLARAPRRCWVSAWLGGPHLAATAGSLSPAETRRSPQRSPSSAKAEAPKPSRRASTTSARMAVRRRRRAPIPILMWGRGRRAESSRARRSAAANEVGRARSLAGDVVGDAVIGRGAHDGQAERHVHRLLEVEELHRDEPLVVVHARRPRRSAPSSVIAEDGVGHGGAAQLGAMPAASARARAMAGAMMRASSSPKWPCSPACGLSPATAMRGAVDAEVARQRLARSARWRAAIASRSASRRGTSASDVVDGGQRRRACAARRTSS